MRRLATTAAAAAVALLAAPAAQALADGSISGTVTRSSDGTGVVGICVNVDSASAGENAEVQTGAGGNYTISALGPATDYTVRFANCSSGTQHNLVSEYYDDAPDVDSADPVTVVDGQTTQNVNAALAAGGRVTGTVTGPGGPLDDVCVRANGDLEAASSETDANGDYDIVGLPTDEYEVEFQPCVEGPLLSEFYDDKPTRDAADPVSVTVGQETSGIDAQLELGATISGTVTGPGGVPLQDVCVNAADPGFDNARADDTAVDGSYQIIGLRTANYKVKFHSCGSGNYATEFYDDKPTRAAADALAVTTGSNTTGIDAELGEGGTITGTVQGPGGTPLDDVCVTSSDDELDGEVAETDVNGFYTLDGLRAGTYRVGFTTCSASDLVGEFYNDKPTRATADPVTVTEGGTTPNINAVLAREGKIRGTVTGPGGTPLSGICVEATDAALEIADSTTTDTLGQYTLDSLRAGGYKVEYTACGPGNFAGEFYNDKPNRATANTVSVNAGATTNNINAELAPGGRITGTVTGPGGAQLDGICVTATDAGAAAGTDQTNGSGQYTIEDLRSGTYKVEFSGCNNSNFVGEFWNDKPTRAAADPIAVATGSTSANIDAELEAGGTIAGTVTGPGGTPLPGVCVIASDSSLNEISTETQPNGQYTLQGLPGGSHKVEFSACGDANLAGEFYDDKPTRAAADAIAVVPGNTINGINAELAAGGQITGNVTGPGGAPLQGACVSAYDSELEHHEPAITDSNGDYTIEDLRSASYKILFEGCDAGNLAHEWYVDEATVANADPVAATTGTTVNNIDAQLADGGGISGTVTDGSDAIAGVCVRALDPASQAVVLATTETAADGGYALDGLATGSFKVHFDGSCASDALGSEYYDDADTYAAGAPVAVVAPDSTGSVNAVLEVIVDPPTVTITSGPNGEITDRRPAFAFNPSAGATVECSITTLAPIYAPCSGLGGHQPGADLSDGTYTFSVRATNAAGSVTDTRTFRVIPGGNEPPDDPDDPVDPPEIPPELAACDEAKQKLIKAKLKLRDAKEAGKKAKIKKAKKKVKKAKKAVQAAC